MKTYGTIQVMTTDGSKEVSIIDFLQMEYTNCRLISCFHTEENQFLIVVENPQSTGRASRVEMLLTEESLFGVLNTMMLFFSKNNINVSKIMQEQYPHDQIKYVCPESDDNDTNIAAFDKQITDKLDELNTAKTMKGWEQSKLDLTAYLQPGDEITEEIYNYIGECVPPTYCTGELTQGGDCQFKEDGVDYYMTASCKNNKYIYLGVLPEFKS